MVDGDDCGCEVSGDLSEWKVDGVQPYGRRHVEPMADGSGQRSDAQDWGCAVQPGAAVVGERLEGAVVWNRLRAQRVVYRCGAAERVAVRSGECEERKVWLLTEGLHCG